MTHLTLQDKDISSSMALLWYWKQRKKESSFSLPTAAVHLQDALQPTSTPAHPFIIPN